jgi:hypothetical protein
MLFQPDRHEKLSDERWSDDAARAAIAEIVDDAERRFDATGWWPAHPLDTERATGPEPARVPDLYVGGAGVVWALTALERRGFAALSRDYRDALGAMAERAQRRLLGQYPAHPPAYLLGDLGVRLVQWKLDPSEANAGSLLDWLERAERIPTLEVMWGSPGVALALTFLLAQRADARARALLVQEVEALLEQWRRCPHAPADLWEQDLYGQRRFIIDSVHGSAGTFHVLLRALDLLGDARRDAVASRASAAIRTLACVEGDEANWPIEVPPRARPDGAQYLVHYCHGSPGFVVCLDPIAPGREPELDALLLRAGNLIWRAGPLRKGPNLCHGTAGNGYAFLKLWKRTGESVWLERARAFAAHALLQLREARRQHGRGRYSLWTGDPGVAVYLAACLQGDASFPTVDEF